MSACHLCLQAGHFHSTLDLLPATTLLWRYLILAVVPILSYIRRYGSQAVVQADQPSAAVRALCASRSAGHSCCPDVWLSSRALAAMPHSLEISLDMPLLLQFWAQHAEIR